MILQLDRRSYTTDLITFTNGIKTCSPEFVTAASEIMSKYGYTENTGVCTDVGKIKNSPLVDCIACNLSCGYINEHSSNEVVSIKHFVNAVNFGAELLVSLGQTKWHHVYTAPVYTPKTQEAPVRQPRLFEDDYDDYQDYYYGRYNSYSGGYDPFDQYNEPRAYGKSKDSYAGTSRLFKDIKEVNAETSKVKVTEEDLASFPEEDREQLRELFGLTKPLHSPIDDEVEEEYDLEDPYEIDAWYYDNYPDYLDLTYRSANLKHKLELDYQMKDISKMTQEEIDDSIMEGVCPHCTGNIAVDNILLLNSYCIDCGSVLNIPKEDYEYLEQVSKGEA